MHSTTLFTTLLTLAATTLHLASASTPTTTTTTPTPPPRPLLRARQTTSTTALSPPPSPTAFDANEAACTSVSSLASSCAALTPSFAALPFTAEASCLCYTAVSTYMPSIYDGYWASCLDWYQTASPEYYSSALSGDSLTRTPCKAAGNVLGGAGATGVVSSVAFSGAGATTAATGSVTGSATEQASGTSGAASRGMGREGRVGAVAVLVGWVVLVAAVL